MARRIERFDRKGPGRDLTVSGDSQDPRERWKQRRVRVANADPAPIRPRNRAERRSWQSNGPVRIFSEEAKRQVGICDLAMVAQASLRASERPFRASGSGKRDFSQAGFVALTRQQAEKQLRRVATLNRE